MVNQAPAGTGPFMVQSRDGDRLRLVPNPNAWRQPRIANVEIVGLTEIAVRLAALKTGEVDMAASILPETVADLRAEGRNVVTVPNFAQTVVLLDSASPDAAPALKDRRVREALSIAIDRQALVQAIAPGIGTPGYQAVAPEAFGYNPALPPIRTDLARARQLVQQSGFAGSTLKMSGVFTAGLGSLTSAQAIVQMMSQTGINVEINQLELAVFLQRYNGGGGDPLMLFPLGAAHHDADGAIANFRDQGNPNRAAVRYSNPEYDAAYQATLRELDRERRRALLQQAIKILYDDWAVIPLGSVPGIFALDRKVQNFKPYEQFVWNWNEMAVQ
jgi:peptide/nickel transport system substrate-binding protein